MPVTVRRKHMSPSVDLAQEVFFLLAILRVHEERRLCTDFIEQLQPDGEITLDLGLMIGPKGLAEEIRICDQQVVHIDRKDSGVHRRIV
jgi:hypothetical protein